MACSRKWLLEKHPIAQQAFFAIGYRPRPKESAIDSPQLSWPIFTLLVTDLCQIKIVVIQPVKSISAGYFR